MPSKENLPPEVAELFARDGEWSNTQHELFFFECDCEKMAVCRKLPNPREDTWIRHCGQDECEWHGAKPVVTVDLDSAEIGRRRHFDKDKRLEKTTNQMLAELDHITRMGALSRHPDTPNAVLLDNIVDTLKRFVFMGRNDLIITALWVVHTYTISAAEFTPYLHMRSALPRSGKSRLLDVLEFVVARPMRFHDPTPAAIADALLFAEFFGQDPPTLLWDEIDNAYSRWSGMREIINAGFQRGTDIVRAGGRRKPTFSPKVMAGLSNLPHTVLDRSFEFDMTRARRDERPERLTPSERRNMRRSSKEIRIQLEAFAERHLEELAEAIPDLPVELDDRAQDISEPLLAIADVVGGDWPEKARKALMDVRQRMFEHERISEREQLLRDIKRVFGERKAMHSAPLVDALKELEDSPWASRSLTPWSLSEMLSEFSEYPDGPRIRPVRFRQQRVLRRGYKAAQFKDAWERYLNGDEE